MKASNPPRVILPCASSHTAMPTTSNTPMVSSRLLNGENSASSLVAVIWARKLPRFSWWNRCTSWSWRS